MVIGARMPAPPQMTTRGNGSPPAAGAIVKHSLAIAGHRTSISLERAFWDRLNAVAAARGMSLAALVAEIDAGRGGANLSSAIRVFVLQSAPAQDFAER
jgi:predicted DNA-binding ribbon-helix-helix protein